MVGKRQENFGVERRWEKKKHVGREDGIFVHLQNGFNGLILNWCIGGGWFIPVEVLEVSTLQLCNLGGGKDLIYGTPCFLAITLHFSAWDKSSASILVAYIITLVDSTNRTVIPI